MTPAELKGAFVYVHLEADTGAPFYVGIGTRKNRPWNLHNRSDHHKNVVAKHGARIEIVIDGLDWGIACFWEIRWIKALRDAGFRLVNLTDGGDGTLGLIAHNRKKVLCLETGELFDSATHAADKFGLATATVTDICRLKYRSAKGCHFVFSNSKIKKTTRDAMIHNIEIKCAARRKKVVINKNRNELVNNGLDRKGRSAAGPIKLSRKVLCLNDNNIYSSASAAAKNYNVAKSALIELCLGKNNRKSVGGYKFKYVEEV